MQDLNANQSGAAIGFPQSSSLRIMKHRLNVVPIGVSYESSEVRVVVLGPQLRLVEDLGPDGGGDLEEAVDGISVRSAEGDVRFPKAVAGLLLSNPEHGNGRSAVADCAVGIFHDPLTTERGQDRVVEGSTSGEIGALKGHMSEHGLEFDREPWRGP